MSIHAIFQRLFLIIKSHVLTLCFVWLMQFELLTHVSFFCVLLTSVDFMFA
jgi:hypothetical protein